MPLWIYVPLLLPLLVPLFGVRWPGATMLLTFAGWGLAAAMAWGAARFEWLPYRGIDRALHDSYYIDAYVRYLFWCATAFALPLVVWGALRFARAAQFPRGFGCSALAMHLGFMIAQVPTVWLTLNGMPRRLIDEPEWFGILNALSKYGTLLALGAMVFILALTVLSVYRRLSRGPAQADAI